MEAVKDIITPDFEVLDIGAGPGTLAIPFAERVRKATAVEPSKGLSLRNTIWLPFCHLM